MKRRKARELALQMLFAAENQGDPSPSPETLAQSYFRNFADKLDPVSVDEAYFKALLNGALEKRMELDALIESHSDHWKLSRMTKIDKNVLRIGAFELKYREDIPASVVIDEAIELAKKYGTDDSAAFTNGILDQVRITLKRDKK